jgi:hypothetical protein
MINFLQTDRREQAKTTSEQEIQSALDYIAQDLKQSVYIYDRDGLTNTGDNGIGDTLSSLGCSGTGCQPILAFWKRRYLAANDIVGGITVGNQNDGNGAFVYSLVVYSLVEPDANEDVWSDAARIVRYEMRDGVNTNNNVALEIPANPPNFEPFDLTQSGNLPTIMNRWSSPIGSPTGDTLIDFIDEPNSATPAVACKQGEQRIPDQSENINGFVVCVGKLDPSAPSARVYLRGNALKRVPFLQDKDYEEQYSSFFPTSSTQVKGNGFLYTQK